MSYTPSPNLVWTYGRRVTNVEVLLNRPSSAITIYNAIVDLNAGDTVIGRLDGVNENGLILLRGKNPLPTYGTETIIEERFNPANAKDLNDYTYTTPFTESVAAGATIDEVKWDLGAVREVLVRVRIQSLGTGLYVRVLVSSNDVTYPTLAEANNSIVEGWYFTSCRYIKLQVANQTASSYQNHYFRFYTVEPYPFTPLPLKYDYTVDKQGSYELLMRKNGSDLANAFLAIVRKYAERI